MQRAGDRASGRWPTANRPHGRGRGLLGSLTHLAAGLQADLGGNRDLDEMNASTEEHDPDDDERARFEDQVRDEHLPAQVKDKKSQRGK